MKMLILRNLKKFNNSMQFIHLFFQLLRLSFIFKPGLIKFTFVAGRSLEFGLYHFRLSIFLPIINLQLFLHRHILLRVPYQYVCEFDPIECIFARAFGWYPFRIRCQFYPGVIIVLLIRVWGSKYYLYIYI
jgi:hypothetical protein